MSDRLDHIVDEWNTLYANKDYSHEASREIGKCTIDETDGDPKLKSLIIDNLDGISFPAKVMDSFTCWDAVNEMNCDGAFLVKEKSDEYNLVFCEMKSKYDTKKISRARGQIIETAKKLNILLNNLDSFHDADIKSTYGIIACNAPDDKQLMWIKNMAQLPEAELGHHKFAIKLYQKKDITIPLPLPSDKKGAIMKHIIPDKITIHLCCTEKNTITYSLPN